MTGFAFLGVYFYLGPYYFGPFGDSFYFLEGFLIKSKYSWLFLFLVFKKDKKN